MSFKDQHDALFDLDTEHNSQAIRMVAMCTYYFNLTLLIIAMFVALVYMFVDGGEFIWISLIILGSCLVEYLGVTAITILIMGKASSLNELHNIKRIIDKLTEIERNTRNGSNLLEVHNQAVEASEINLNTDVVLKKSKKKSSTKRKGITYYCPTCNNKINSDMDQCPKCGQELDWD